MPFLRYLAKNVSVLNVLLGGVVFVVLAYALFPLFSVKTAYKPHPADTKRSSSDAPAEIKVVQAPSPADYTVVAQNNLFHPDRKIPPEKAEEKELPKPELILYGTIISPDLNVAYVEDKKAPYTTQSRGKRQRALKKGDFISGFVLKEIEPNRITLVRNGEVITFNLDTEKEREEATRAGAPASLKGSTVPVTASPPPLRRSIPPSAAPAPAENALAPRSLPTLKTQIPMKK